MVPRVAIAGLVVFILGFVTFSLFFFVGIVIPPFAGRTADITDQVTIGRFGSTDELVGVIPPHPLFVRIKAVFLVRSDSDVDCNVQLIYENQNQGIYTEIGSPKQITGSTPLQSDYLQRSISITISPQAASSEFKIWLSITNNGNSPLILATRRVEATFSLFAWFLPAIVAIIGLVIGVVGFVRGGRPAVPKRPKVTPGWEPTLQWGGTGSRPTAEPAKKSRFAIKSSKAPKTTTKKVVRKVAPAGGGKTACNSLFLPPLLW
jgi:hypothetical protein